MDQTLFTRRRIYDDLGEEIQQHLDEKTEALVAEGMTREQAARSARREFGNITHMSSEAGRRGCGPWRRACWRT